MNIVDATCTKCGAAFQWLSGTPRMCVPCRTRECERREAQDADDAFNQAQMDADVEREANEGLATAEGAP